MCPGWLCPPRESDPVEDNASPDSDERHHAAKDNRNRMAWHLLTLGIPLLIQTFSMFFEGLIRREKTELSLRVRFKSPNHSLKQIASLMKLHLFNEIADTALNKAEENKAVQLMNRLINDIEKAKASDNLSDVESYREKLNPIICLLEKCRKLSITRKDFDGENWKALDLIDFELAKEHFEHLHNLFNSFWFLKLGVRTSMKLRFNVDYHEALVAESLSLSLAYIEGLDGKTIEIPVLDQKSRKYQLVPHKIRETRLGDALPCYVLESENNQLPPWFIVRGTQYYTGASADGKEYRTGGLESILADALDHECITRNIINKSLVHRPIVKQDNTYVQRESLSDIFQQWHDKGKKAILCGHSLGGTLVNALAVEFYGDVKTAYAFSAAGVSLETATRWDQLKKEQEGLDGHPKLVNFDYEGDIIPAGGRRLIGMHLAIEPLAQLVSNRIYVCHVRSHLNHDFQIQKVDTVKENRKWARLFCEQLRIITGRCFRLLIALFNGNYLPDWWKNRKIYREYAAFHRLIRLSTQ